MSRELVIFVGGPADSKVREVLWIDKDLPAELEVFERLPEGQWSRGELPLHKVLYRLERIQILAPGPKMPPNAYVHPSVPRDEVIWHSFMAVMRLWAREVLRGGKV